MSPTLSPAMHSPTSIFHWTDPQPTGAEGWVVLDTIVNQVTGGGIFMKADTSLEEVSDVARNMSWKFTLTAPQIGGAKAGIRYDHTRADAPDVLRRFLIDQRQLLTNVWVTAGDLNTDDAFIEQVIRDEIGLRTCQSTLARRIGRTAEGQDRSRQLAKLLGMHANPFFLSVEAAVGYGMARAIEYVTRASERRPRVAVQGFGAVGSSMAYFLEQRGIADVVGICDKDGWLSSADGLPVQQLLTARRDHVDQLRRGDARASQIAEASKNLIVNLDAKDWPVERRPAGSGATEFLLAFGESVRAEVFSPCAMRYAVTPEVAKAFERTLWRDADRRFLVAGANNPFGQGGQTEPLQEDRAGLVLGALRDANVEVLPDWVANSGTAQFFHLALGREIPCTQEGLDLALDWVGDSIEAFLNEAVGRPGDRDRDLYDRCATLAQERLHAPRHLDHVGLPARSPVQAS